MTSEPITTACPHCGMDRADACGHPATPAPCWAEDAQARWLANHDDRDAARHYEKEDGNV